MKQFSTEALDIHLDVQAIEHIEDVILVDSKLDSLVDAVAVELDAVLSEANDALFSARALANRPIIEKL